MASASNTMSNLGEATSHAKAPEESGRQELAWMRQAQEGDRSAYGHVVFALQDRLYNAMFRMVGDPDEARELTQEAFTRGLMKIDSFRGDAGPYTWLFRIAVNLAISQLRKVQRQRTFSLDAASSEAESSEGQAAGLLQQLADRAAATPEEQALKRERATQVVEALGRLDSEYRAVLVMRDVEGFDYQQMADILELPLGTLKSRLFRARLALREQLIAYEVAERRKADPGSNGQAGGNGQ